MPIPDDEQLEKYLRQFKPLAPDPLPTGARRRLWRVWFYAVPAAAAIALLLVVLFRLRGPSRPVIAPQAGSSAVSEAGNDLVTSQPLTLQQANGLLSRAPSFTEALDDIAFHRQHRKLPQGSLSALAALSKEDIKL